MILTTEYRAVLKQFSYRHIKKIVGKYLYPGLVLKI